MALSKVLNCWGARFTRTAQKEHVAQVIRGVESHKVVAAFLYSATGREGSVPGGRVGRQRGWLSNGRTGWGALGLTSGLVGTGWLAGAGVSHVPTV